MHVHVIYAHPLKDSLAAQLHEIVLDELTKAGHTVDDLDLYAEGFDPVLSAEERRDYHDTSINQKYIRPYVERLQRAEGVVLCHPVWNFGWPAILKGYFDRVFLPDVSFKMKDGMLYPGLTNIRRLATVTTYGSPRWRAWVLGDPPRKNGTRFLRAVCHPNVKVTYHALYNINNVTPEMVDNYLKKVRKAMSQF
ncbi:NAD(P)H-dependent oxidoreductase [Chelativorans composti]|jgi:Putative NADPH-quinone reductase (modulator of drug activity B)|uniref:NAD(P)H-dependent oxidoreductase n=1 Tax=Chelativorans composti TaxID=768533 RepID=A0ABW5DEH4_9HYPH|nr:NAD(P)H-dependent oxidoreductase [bacterium SGD-2]